jgi:hypothetical protein
MRLFLAYPYFGNSTLEHDPSLGLESLPTLVTPTLLLLVVGSASVITIAVLAVRWKRNTVNLVGAQENTSPSLFLVERKKRGIEGF